MTDTTAPTATIAISDTDLTAGETATLTITFSEYVIGLDNSDLSISNGTVTGLTSSDEGITWTGTFTPTADTHANGEVWIHTGGVTDLYGNPGTTSATTGYFNINTTDAAPTATVTVASNALDVGDTSSVSIVFSEAVSGFDASDLTVANGTLTDLASTDGGISWTGTLTPDAGVEASGNVITLNLAGVTDAGNNTGAGNATSNVYAIDTLAPTAQVVMGDTFLTGADTSSVTITFNEMVSGFTADDLTVSNGTLSALMPVDEGSTWTATFTPDANTTATTNTITVANSGVADLRGNAGTGTSSSSNFTIDTQGPVPTIIVSDTALKAGDTAQVQISFTEAVADLSNDDLTVEGGTLSALTTSDGGLTYAATLTPSADTTDYNNLITINNAGLTDAEGNAGVGSTASANYTVDTAGPAAPTMSLSAFFMSSGQTAVLTITFAEPVTNFTNADLHVDNGTLTTLTNTDGEGVTWTATFTPNGDVVDDQNYITLNMANVTDLSGNAGASQVATTGYYGINTLNPAPTATVSLADSALTAGETSAVNIVFSEAVTGLTVDDLTVSNGTVSNLTSSDEGINWTGTFTPDAGVEAGGNTISLDLTGVADAGGKAGVGSASSAAYSVDTIAPTAAITMSDTSLIGGETAQVTITFNEMVTGFTADDLTVSNGTLSALTAGEGSTWTATFTPDADVSDTSNTITVANSGVADLSGNAGAGSTASANYTVNTLNPAPTATVSLADSALAVGETSAVNIAFSEAVTGLTVDDLTVSNGTVSNLTSSDEGINWTGTFTPDAGVEAGSNTISLNLTGVADFGGKAGVGSASSAAYSVDTIAPTAAITISDTSLSGGETAQVTITFNETVTGFTAEDLTVSNGTLSALTAGEGSAWTATFTPDADVQYFANTITLDNTGIADAAGNAGAGTTESANFVIENTAPTATISMADTALAIGETSLVTITFSEAVTHFDATDLTLDNGTIGALVSADEGVTWTGTFTPNADVADTTNVITLNNAGLTDFYGNAGAGTTQSANYTVATQLPTPTPTPTPAPVVPGTLVDGVKVVTKTTTAADGSKVEAITIPTVVSTRTNTDGAAATADIPLVTSAAGVRVLEASLPIGFGLQVSGAVTPKAAPDALAGLIAAIEARTTTGSQEQAAMVAGGSDFLGSLASDVPMVVRTLVATAASSANASDALVISGAVSSEGAPKTALVIDASALPDGSAIQLQNVEFAAVIGSVRVTGGAGSQSVWGDGAAQNIFLGADDDVLHGGAGDDTVGSAGGDDQVFGDEGNDIVFGGAGNDMIDGGSGRDIVQLAGAGRDDYTMRVVDGKLVMTQRDGGADGIDTVSNVEVLRFAGAPADVDFNDIDVASLVRLYDTAFGRAADEGGINFWIARAENGATLGDIAADFLASAEAQPLYAQLSNSDYVTALYVEGLGRSGSAAEVQWWVDHLDHGNITRGETLLAFADSAEKIALVGVIDTSITTM